jgi:imidazolonepropionase-like amidohydrolase
MLVFPRGGLISGRCSAMRMDGWTWEDMTIDADAGLVVNWPRTEPINAWWMEQSEEQQRRSIREDLDAVEQFFDDAAAYVKARDADPTLTTDLRYEGMRAVLAKEKPVFVSAALAGQIESAVGWAVRRGLNIVIVGGDQADRVSHLLKKHDIPVIIGGIHRMPSRAQDDFDQAYALPAKLHEAGVRFCIATGGEAAHERHLNHNAGTAAAYGLPKDEALKSLTLNAADIIGLGSTLGSLDNGKAATLIVTTGDPLEITTDTLMAYIDGRRIDLASRHTMLYHKYQEKYRQLGLLPPEQAEQPTNRSSVQATTPR